MFMESNANNFKKMTTLERYEFLRDCGDYLDSRKFGFYQIHLYQSNGFFSEIWMTPGTNKVQWIEIADPYKVVENYTKRLNIKDELGI